MPPSFWTFSQLRDLPEALLLYPVLSDLVSENLAQKADVNKQ